MRASIEDKRFELIKTYCLDPDPEKSALSDEHKEILDRWISASKVLDRYPVQKRAVALHQAKFPDLSRAQAYNDLKNAMRLFNSMHTFDYDWWHSWLINDIAAHIQACRDAGDRKNWGVAHANLIKALGEKPDIPIDPKLIEKNTFIFQVNINNQVVNIDAEKLMKIPPHLRKELFIDALDAEITDDQAEEIMNS